MNIFMTISSYPPAVGGAQTHAHHLMMALKHSHQVQVASFWDAQRTDWLMGTTLRTPDKARDYVIDGVPVQRMGFSSIEKLRMLPWVGMYYFWMGRSIANIAGVIGPQLDALTIKGVDLVHNVRVGREPLSYASYELARARKVPFVLTPLHHPRWGGWLHRHYQELYRRADLVFTLTKAEKYQIAAFGVDEKRIDVIGNGAVVADTANGQEFREVHGLQDVPMVLFLGQKYAYKGIDSLLKATVPVWQKYPEIRFVFIGPRTDYSRKLFAQYPDKRILELDTVDLQTKTNALDACTLLCVPSSQESFGGVYTEAWSLKKPVIGCKIPAVSEVIDDGVNGYLVQQEPESISEKILYLIENPSVAKAMGLAGKEKTETLYTWEQIAKCVERAYMRVV